MNKTENLPEVEDIDENESTDEEGVVDPYALYNLGWEHLRKGEFLQAFPNIENAFDAARSRGNSELLTLAIKDFTKEIAEGKIDQPSYCYCFRGMCYSSLKSYDKALDDMTSAIENEKEPVIRGGFHFHRGLIRNKMNMLEGAIGDFTKAMDLDPDGSCNAVVFRFLVNYKLGRRDKMREDYQIIEEMENVPLQFMDDIRSIAARFLLAKGKDQNGEDPTEDLSPEERRIISNAMDEKEEGEINTAPPIEAEARAEAGSGGVPSGLDLPNDILIPPEVEEEVNKLSNPEKLQLLKVELAKFEQMTKEQDEQRIIQYLTTGDMGRMSLLLDWFNSEAKLWKTKFESAKKLVREEKDYRSAIPILSECLEFEPEHSETIYLRAVCHYHLDDIEPAFEDVRQAIHRDSTNPRYYSLLGYIMVSTGELDNSIVAFKKAIEINPEPQTNHEFHYILAILFEKIEDYEASARSIDEALILSPTSADYKEFKRNLDVLKQNKDGLSRLAVQPEEQEVKEEEEEEEIKEPERIDSEKMRGYRAEYERELKKKELLEAQLEELNKREAIEKQRWEGVQDYLQHGGDDRITVDYLRQLAGSDDEEVDEEGELSEDDEDEEEEDVVEVEERKNKPKKRRKKVTFQNMKEEVEEEESEGEEEEEEGELSLAEAQKVVVNHILRDGDKIILDVLKALNLEKYYERFRKNNIVWFDVVHGYLREEDYAEVFPRIRFMRRFVCYVEKYVIRTDRGGSNNDEDNKK